MMSRIRSTRTRAGTRAGAPGVAALRGLAAAVAAAALVGTASGAAVAVPQDSMQGTVTPVAVTGPVIHGGADGKEHTLMCPPDENAMGGGFKLSGRDGRELGDTPSDVLESRPTDDATGWIVAVRKDLETEHDHPGRDGFFSGAPYLGGGRDAGGQDAGRPDFGGQSMGAPGMGGQGMGGPSMGSQEGMGGRLPGAQDVAEHGVGGHDFAGQHAGRPDLGGQDLGGQDAGQQQSGTHDSGGQDLGGQQAGGQDAGQQQDAGAPGTAGHDDSDAADLTVYVVCTQGENTPGG